MIDQYYLNNSFRLILVELLIKLYQMSFLDQVFNTEIRDQRPQTTNKLARQLQDQHTPYSQLKLVKDRAKSMQREYLQQKIHHDRVKKKLEEINHKSAIKRMEFLKVYGNKKAKFHNRQLLENTRQERQKFERKSLDLVKRRKLQYELQQILIQNEEQERVYQLQKSNKHDKEVFSRQLLVSEERQRSFQHHQEVKRRQTQFVIRKRNLQTAITMRSKGNYYTKVHQQLNLIQNYEKILNEVQSFAKVGEIEQSKVQNTTICNTIDVVPSLFLTSKNTIQ